MKPHIANRQVETFGLGQTTGFQIRATAKAFEILSSGLYKDKITAILREISANAYDAHIAAGIVDRPIALHLPTTLAPYLSIRDFGAGLSQNHMETVCQTYFYSLKEDSDNYVGGLGLGMKSPFSYTDAYSIISRHDGRKITYDLFKTETGEPAIAARSDEELPEGEETGLEVIVPVANTADIGEFARKARFVFEYYPVKPVFTGYRFEGVAEHTFMMEGKGWRIHSRNSNSGYRGARAVMGIIGYPIDQSQLVSYDGGNDQKLALIRKLLETPIDFDFGIGELDITAGREELSYVKSTKALIIKRVSEAAKELHQNLMDQFKQCKNIIEARILYGKLFHYNSPMYVVFGHNYTVKFAGVEISSTQVDIQMANYPEARLMVYKNSNRGSFKYVQEVKFVDDAVNRYRAASYIFDVSEIENTKFYYDDLEGAGFHSARIFNYRTITQNNPKVILFLTTDDDELQAYREFLAGVDILPVSSLPKPVYERNYTKAKIKRLRRAHATREHFEGPKDGPWEDEEILVEKGGIYVISHRGVISRNGEHNENRYFSGIYYMANALGLLEPEEQIIAIPASQSKQFADSKKHEGKWVSFYNLIRERGNAALTPDKIDLLIAKAEQRNFTEPCVGFVTLVKSLSEELGDDHVISQFTNRYTGKWIDDLYFKLAAFCEVQVGNGNINYKMEWKAVANSYPAIKLMLHDYARWDTDSTKILLDYIRLIDQTTTNA